MSEYPEHTSRYFAALDNKSQRAIEKKNLRDNATDILLMSASQFKDNFHSLLRTEVDIFLSRYGNHHDKYGNYYNGMLFVTAERPQITFEQGAYPCSLVFAFDSEGNFAVLHLTRYDLFLGQPNVNAQQDQEIINLEKLVKTQMADDARIVISATNVKTDLQNQVVDSIKLNLKNTEPDRIDTLFMDGSRLYKDGNIPPGFAPNTKDSINSVYFIPRHFSYDGKNKIILCGDAEGASNESVLWLISHFGDLFPQRPWEE